MEDKITISIFGSCVSRDLLEFDRQSVGRFEIGEYIARQSIVTALGKPISFQEEEIVLRSKFQKNLVINDLRKTTFDRLSASQSRYLMIDLIDERFRIGRMQDSMVTISNEFVQSGLYDAKKISLCRKNHHMVDSVPLEEYIEPFVEKLLTIFSPNHIILHKTFFLDEYRNRDGVRTHFPERVCRQNAVDNDWIGFMYDKLEQKMPGVIVLDCCRDWTADENHKWALAPMHYVKEYYETALEQLYQNV